MHLSLEEVLDLIEGQVGEAHAQFLTAHLRICSDCDRQLSYWKEMRSLLKQTHLESAPAEVLKMAEAIHPVASQKPSRIREIMAILRFDSFAQHAFAGARGTSAARQFLFSAEEIDIHVKVWGVPPVRRMVGQILFRGERKYVLEGTRLHLLRNEERLETTEADWFGEFEFKEVPEGLLKLQIELPQLTVTGSVNVG